MSKKKKIIFGSIAVIIVVAILIYFKTASTPKGTDVNNASSADDIEYFNVNNIEQVFINGTVTPVQSEEFVKDTTLGKLGDLQVTDGQVVEAGTLLYQYDNNASDAEINQMRNSIQEQQSARAKAIRQRDVELKELQENPETNTQTARDKINLNYDVASYDQAIAQLQQQLNDANSKKITKITAPFKGKVVIPQDKKRESAILTLVSEDFYVVGSVNEKDIEKVAVDQPASIKLISSDKTVNGHITYIADQPASSQTDAAAGGADASNSTMSGYLVKLALDSTEGIKSGFHVQAAISLGDTSVTLPTKAIHYDGNTPYVLVDDFGTVVRKNLELAPDQDKKAKETKVLSGLEAEDRVIVSSKQKLKNGDILPGAQPESSDSTQGDQ